MGRFYGDPAVWPFYIEAKNGEKSGVFQSRKLAEDLMKSRGVDGVVRDRRDSRQYKKSRSQQKAHDNDVALPRHDKPGTQKDCGAPHGYLTDDGMLAVCPKCKRTFPTLASGKTIEPPAADVAKEEKEHPWASEDTAERIAADHAEESMKERQGRGRMRVMVKCAVCGAGKSLATIEGHIRKEHRDVPTVLCHKCDSPTALPAGYKYDPKHPVFVYCPDCLHEQTKRKVGRPSSVSKQLEASITDLKKGKVKKVK